MKCGTLLFCLFFCMITFGQELSDQEQIKITLNNYIDGFYKGDTTKLKQALKPRLYKFGYLKNEANGNYEYYEHLSFKKALALAQRIKESGRIRRDTLMRGVKVLDIGQHIAAAKVTAAWGMDYVLLSKDDNKWMIEEVVWEGPYIPAYKADDSATTYYLIRHAEKNREDSKNRNPELTEKGQERAERWAQVFKNIPLDAIYTTNYKRTISTALPTAEAKDLELIYYKPNKTEYEKIKANPQGQHILIVGHSDTTPALANILLSLKRYNMMEDDNNGNLYIVTIKDNEAFSQKLFVD